MKLLKIIKNEYIFTSIVKIFSLLIGFVYSILLARYLGTELQGKSTYILSIVSILSIIATFGIHHAYPFFKKNKGDLFDKNRYVSIVTLYFFLVFIISLFVSFLFHDLQIKIAIILLAIFGYSNVVQYICLIESPNKKNFAFLIALVINLLSIITAFIFIKKSYLIMAILLIIKDFCLCIFSLLIIKPKFIFDKKTFSLFPKMAKFGFFPMVSLLLTNLNYRIDVLMLKQFDGIGFSLIGVYSIGISLSDKIALVPDTLMGVLASKLSKGANHNEVAKVCRISFLFSLIISVLAIALGYPFISIFYGSDYIGAYFVVCITAVGAMFVGFYKLIAQFNIIQGKQIRNVLIVSLSVVTNVIFNLLLIPKFGINGAAIASCLGHFISGFIIMMWFSINEKIDISKLFIIQNEDTQFFKKLGSKNKYL